MTTAGNLVFQMINDGSFRAFSADKGEKLFEVKTGRTGMAPPITTRRTASSTWRSWEAWAGRRLWLAGPMMR